MNWLSYLNGSGHLFTMVGGFAGHETHGQLDFATRFTPMASPAVLARGALAMLRYDETATLSTISVPTLVVVGEHDRVTVPQASELISRSVPRARLVLLRGTGHMGLLDQHAQLQAAVAEPEAAAPASQPLRETA